MKSSSLYGHLAELLGIVRGSRTPADTLVRHFFRERRYIGARERRWLSSRLFGIVRHVRLLEQAVREAFQVRPDFAGAAVPEDDQRLALAIAAAYAIVYEGDAVPDVCDAVGERWSVDFPGSSPEAVLGAVNEWVAALARRPASASTLALRHSFPEEVVEEWVDRIGTGETEQLMVALNREAPLSIRVNTLKCTVAECADRLRAGGIDVQPGTVSPFALTLQRRAVLDAIPTFREGLFEMQDEGSQILSLLLQPEPGMTVVDACAGGGGKTLHIAALLQNHGTLIAIDPERRKLENLRERARRAGALLSQIIEARHDDPALSRLHGRADAVLVDAPCSGIGTVRRNPWLKLEWGSAQRACHPELQLAILESAASMVRKNGRLVYSTCTLVNSENQDVVERFLRDHPDFTLSSASEILRAWGIQLREQSALLTLWPHHTGTDGFFAAVMHRRTAD